MTTLINENIRKACTVELHNGRGVALMEDRHGNLLLWFLKPLEPRDYELSGALRPSVRMTEHGSRRVTELTLTTETGGAYALAYERLRQLEDGQEVRMHLPSLLPADGNRAHVPSKILT
jgi:hypothetical protein